MYNSWWLLFCLAYQKIFSDLDQSMFNFKSAIVMIICKELERFYCRKFLNQSGVKIEFSNGNERPNSKSLTLNETWNSKFYFFEFYFSFHMKFHRKIKEKSHRQVPSLDGSLRCVRHVILLPVFIVKTFNLYKYIAYLMKLLIFYIFNYI